MGEREDNRLTWFVVISAVAIIGYAVWAYSERAMVRAQNDIIRAEAEAKKERGATLRFGLAPRDK